MNVIFNYNYQTSFLSGCLYLNSSKIFQQLKIRINSRAPKKLQELKHIVIEKCKIIPFETTSNLVTNYSERLLKFIKMICHTIDY